jgi:FkbM family methyltransferase
MKLNIKQILKNLFRKPDHFKKSILVKHKWYGNTYGGFYICPDFLNENSIVYSFGIGEDVSFDNDIIRKHNCCVFGFDPTPKSIFFVKNNNVHDKFKFFEYGIGIKNEYVDFFLPINPEYVSGSVIKQKNIDISNNICVQMKILKDIMNEFGHTHIDILKLDIEGSEYDVIENILNDKISITQIVIEFHDRFMENGSLKSKQTIDKLNSHGYEIFAISDSFEEISFINKSVL